jgi:hypothetical protein
LFLSLLLPVNIKLAFVKMGFISLLLEIIFYLEKSICERALGVFDGLPVEEVRNHQWGSMAFGGTWRKRGQWWWRGQWLGDGLSLEWGRGGLIC